MNSPPFAEITARCDGGECIDPRTWLSMAGSYDLAVAFTSLFWPSFTIHDDCVFLAPFSDESRRSYEGFMQQTGGHKPSVEAVMNHRHIVDLFPAAEAKPTRNQVAFIGRTLQEMWRLKLRRDFPDRNIQVELADVDSDDFLDYEITFFHAEETRKLEGS